LIGKFHSGIIQACRRLEPVALRPRSLNGIGERASTIGLMNRSPSCTDPNTGSSMRRRAQRKGFTVIELIVAMTILMILTAAAVPVVRMTIQRNKERDLRHSLWEMRDAIDRYKDAADRGAFQVKVDSQGYPPDLETLVKGVDSNGKKMRFLRRIPVDPMTGKTEWGLRSMQDEPDSDSWGGQNVFDVYTKSEGTALDGTKYKAW
jgi:general secretion pathway protein G